jgi:ATP-binding cassette subfamily F protein 3
VGELPEGGGAAKALTEKDRRRAEAEARQVKSRTAGPLKKEVAQLEARIAALEAQQKEREQALVDPAFASDYARSRPVMEAHREGVEELEALYARWEAASAALSAL